MEPETADIWFGPGAEKGVFGAGVAQGLHELIHKGELEPSGLRLYGSSIGCLTAVFLATGNAASGLSIFQEETRRLVTASNLLPATAARIMNRILRVSRLTDSLLPVPPLDVPSVLNLDHVFDVMAIRVPQVVDQLRLSPMPVFAETVDRRGTFRHSDLRSATEPLREIRKALNFVPFADSRESDAMDSVIKGYGFVELLRDDERPLVVVLNAKPTTRSSTTIRDLTCAALSGDFRVAGLHVRSRSHRRSACQHASRAGRNVLLVSPPRVIKLTDPSAFETSHALGIQAAARIVSFLQASDSASSLRHKEAAEREG